MLPAEGATGQSKTCGRHREHRDPSTNKLYDRRGSTIPRRRRAASCQAMRQRPADPYKRIYFVSQRGAVGRITEPRQTDRFGTAFKTLRVPTGRVNVGCDFTTYLFARSQSDRNDVRRGLAAQGRRANNQQSWERSAKSSMSSLQRNAQTMSDMTANIRVGSSGKCSNSSEPVRGRCGSAPPEDDRISRRLFPLPIFVRDRYRRRGQRPPARNPSHGSR